MTRMTGPDCVAMYNLINTHAHTHTHTHTRERGRDGAGTGTGAETRRRTLDGNGDGIGDGREDSSSGNGNGDSIGEGGRDAKKRKKPQNSCRRQVGNVGDLGGKREKCRKERVGPVAVNPDNRESNKEAEG